jgi:group I intron endonuclease
MKSGVYEIRNSESGRRYVGSTSDLERRERDHFRDLRAGNHINPIMQRSFDLHGEEAFSFQVLERCEDYRSREQELLDTGPYLDRETGFNICRGATGGAMWHEDHPRYEEICQLMSEINAGEGNPMFGKEHSEKARGRMKERAKGRFSLEWFKDRHGDKEGRKLYDERCRMLSEREYDNPMDDPEARAKLSRALTGRNVTWGDRISEAKKGTGTGADNARWVDVDMHAFKEAVGSGESLRTLEQTFGCSERVIYSRLKKLGFSGLREARRALG